MRAVYYMDDSLGFCPVKIYLAQYIKKERDKSKEKNHKDNILSNIDAKIKFVVENSGLPIPPISLPLRSYSYFEIKHRKNKNILIRIFYFRHKDKIVLLNALEKPDNYNKIKEIKKIDKQLKITEEYKNKFISNPKLYEEYQ
jgi:hypothetical protein